MTKLHQFSQIRTKSRLKYSRGPT